MNFLKALDACWHATWSGHWRFRYLFQTSYLPLFVSVFSEILRWLLIFSKPELISTISALMAPNSRFARSLLLVFCNHISTRGQFKLRFFPYILLVCFSERNRTVLRKRIYTCKSLLGVRVDPDVDWSIGTSFFLGSVGRECEILPGSGTVTGDAPAPGSSISPNLWP